MRADTTCTLAMRTGFAGIGYSLYDNAALNPAGSGTVNIYATIASRSQAALRTSF